MWRGARIRYSSMLALRRGSTIIRSTCRAGSSSASRWRAFVIEPDILFADEPTGSLDAANGRAVIDLLFELNRASGATLVLVTHDTELAQRCDAILALEAGWLV